MLRCSERRPNFERAFRVGALFHPSAMSDATAPAPDEPAATAAEPTVSAEEAARAAEYSAFAPRFALGRGQFGIVYLCQHADGRKAVDKRVGLQGLSKEQLSQTFREIDLLRRLNHDYVVKYYHSWETDELESDKGGAPTRTLHILMEYCEEGSLEEALTEQKDTYGKRPFPTSKIRGWLRQLTSALDYIHSQRVIHRDLKTANILLTGKDAHIAKLGDFGISRLMSSQTNFASTAVGTPYYLSPELITSDGYDGRADIWSLGVILYELIAFVRPFHGDNIAQLAMAIARKAPSPLPAGTPQDMIMFIERCLKKDKTTRPTAHELLHTEPMATWSRQAQEQSQESQQQPQQSPSTTPLDATTDSVPSTSTTTPLEATTDEMLSALPTTKAGGSASEEGDDGRPKLPRGDTVPLSSNSGGKEEEEAGMVLEALLGGDGGGDEGMEGALSLEFTRLGIPGGLRQLYQWRTIADQSGCGSASDPIWQVVDALVGKEVICLSQGINDTAILTHNGELYTWKASGADIDLSFAPNVRAARRPAASEALHAKRVALGNEVLLLLDKESKLWEWLSDNNKPSPLRCNELPSAAKVLSVSCGYDHCAASTSEGLVYTWGRNEDGQVKQAATNQL